MTSRLRLRLALFLLAAVSVLIALAISEAAVRLLRPQFVMGPDPISNPFWVHDDLLGWRHEPGAEGTFTREEFSHRVHINSAGWRDREWTADKPKGLFRIVVLGDSFTWGHGVEDEEIYTRLLSSDLPSVEVLNFGLSASSTDQQLLILRTRALSWHPDLVLVMVSRNDFEGNVSSMEGSYPKPMFVRQEDGGLRLTHVPVPQISRVSRANGWLRRRLALLNLIESSLPDESGQAAGGGGRGEDPLEMTCALLTAIRDDAAAAGASTVVALAPSTAHTYLEPIPQMEARRFQSVIACGERHGFPVLDLVPAFRGAARDAKTGARVELHYRFDKHWNAEGHRVAADALAGMLVERGLVPVGGAAGRL